MQDPTHADPQASRREPRNKGKLIGAKPRLSDRSTYGQFAPSCKSRGEDATWPCSISPSIASSEAVTLSA